MKVKKVLVSAFLLAICLMNVQAQRRNDQKPLWQIE